MSKLMIVTHGNLSSALLATAELIVGRQKDVVTFGVDLGCSLEKLTDDIRKTMAALITSAKTKRTKKGGEQHEECIDYKD